MTLELRRAALPEVPWAELDALPSRTITQSRAWLDFLVETQRVEPVVARIVESGEVVGWFTGAIARIGGIKLLGSPLPGWTTAAMGCSMLDGRPVEEALAALPAFAFDELGCWHLEVADRALTDPSQVPAGFEHTAFGGYELVLGDDDELRSGMKRDARYNIGLAGRRGVTIEEVDPADPGDFAATYYAQVSEAFAKRNLTPTYPVERVEAMVRHLGPTGRLLLLRARTATGDDAATGIFPFQPGGTAEYWMGGSFRRHQADKPNELLMWRALTTARDRGAVRMNFGGGGSYKAKYGGTDHAMPWLRQSRWGAVAEARRRAHQGYRALRARARRRAR